MESFSPMGPRRIIYGNEESSPLTLLHAAPGRPVPGGSAPMEIVSVGTPALWLGFTGFVFAMLALDLGIFHRKAHEVGVREETVWSAVWISLALAFNGLVHHWFGPERALEFLTGYLIEKALAVDNIFVFCAIFAYFAVPAAYQHRVLF
jgi:tellurite resistance protein TerC